MQSLSSHPATSRRQEHSPRVESRRSRPSRLCKQAGCFHWPSAGPRCTPSPHLLASSTCAATSPYIFQLPSLVVSLAQRLRIGLTASPIRVNEGRRAVTKCVHVRAGLLEAPLTRKYMHAGSTIRTGHCKLVKSQHCCPYYRVSARTPHTAPAQLYTSWLSFRRRCATSGNTASNSCVSVPHRPLYRDLAPPSVA